MLSNIVSTSVIKRYNAELTKLNKELQNKITELQRIQNEISRINQEINNHIAKPPKVITTTKKTGNVTFHSVKPLQED